MAQIRPHTLSGFMELLPAPQAQMEAIMDILRKTYSLYGFCALDTPAIEAADVLLAKGGGISIGLTRLFYVLSEQNMLSETWNTAPADVLVLPMTDDLTPAIELATELRQTGIRTQLYTEAKKFKAKIQYADKLSIPYVIFLGEDEIAAGTLSVKDLKAGEQVSVSRENAINIILDGIARSHQGTILK